MKLQREIKINPAFDCIEVQPCKFGSEKCGSEPGRNHGRHGAEMILTIGDDIAQIIVVIMTNWYHSATPPMPPELNNIWKRCTEAIVHSSYPLTEDSAKVENCDKWGVCYNQRISSLTGVSSKVLELLLIEGSDAAFNWLEEQFTELTLVSH